MSLVCKTGDFDRKEADVSAGKATSTGSVTSEGNGCFGGIRGKRGASAGSETERRLSERVWQRLWGEIGESPTGAAVEVVEVVGLRQTLRPVEKGQSGKRIPWRALKPDCKRKHWWA